MLTNPKCEARAPRFDTLPPKTARLLRAEMTEERHRRGATLFGPDAPAKDLLFVQHGTLRVQRQGARGRRRLLYRIRARLRGCDLTTACLLALEPPDSEAVAETDVRVLRVPREVFEALMLRSKAFRACLFKAYSRRLVALGDAVAERALPPPPRFPSHPHNRRI